MNETQTDQDIVRGLRDGGREAWIALCETYSSRVWMYVARLVGSDDNAVADVFQETMLAVAKAGRNLDAEDTTVWAWLARIGHNQAALYWRRSFRERHAGPIAGETIGSVDGDPVEVLKREQTVDEIRLLLAEMPADSVAILSGKYIDELSIAELVAVFGGTTEGIRSKLARARRDFRERYERLNVDSRITHGED